MPAPKGNKFWEARASCGRDKVFSNPESLWNACVEYFEWNVANPLYKYRAIPMSADDLNNPEAVNLVAAEPIMRPMTREALCTFLGCTTRTWANYRCTPGYEDFFQVVEEVEQIIDAQLFEGAGVGIFKDNLIIRKLGLKDTQEHDHKSTDGSMSPKPAIDASKLSDATLKEILAARAKSDE